MKNVLSIILILIAMGCTQQRTFTYPETAKGDLVDDYHGTEVPDPYRWLEDDMSDETAVWVKAQNEVTFSYLESIPFRDALKERMTEIWNYPKMGTPLKEGDLYFYSYNTGLQNQSIIYMKKSLEEEGEVFLDPNGFSEDGTVALAGLSFSNDHKYVAYGISKGGSDWREFFIKDIATGSDLEDHIEWIKNSGVSWYKNGFFYTRFDTPAKGDELKGENKNAKAYYHQVGTLQSKDVLVHKDEANPDRSFHMGVTEDEKYIMLVGYESTSGNSLAFKKAGLDDTPFTWIDEDFDDDYSPIGNHKNILYVLTNNQAPLYRLVGIDLNNPGQENWVDIIPEHEKNVLESATLAGGKIIASYIKDAYNTSSVYQLDGSLLHEVSIPGIGSIGGFSGKMKDNTAFYSFTSFNYPTTTFKYNIEKNIAEVFYTPEVDFDADAYETKQVFYPSKDGTSIPMFIVHKKGVKLDGTNPTLLYGYGGFNISMTPSFSTTRAVWLEQGGVFALANIRGGGEYGEAWHKAGTILQKQNVFDDFIAAAEYLIEEKYTSSQRLAIYGGSNGGLLIGAVINQRPELFAVAIPMVGVMDMLRFHKFTIGRYWTVDYGSSDDPEEFKYLLGYSPVHNISAEKDYPAVLITTGDHDDRVVPAHSFKYAATLQENYTGNNPVMIRINTDAGHGAGKPTDMVIQEYSDVWSFLYKNMEFTPEF
ncbi:MAG: prolyl oligopeptidase family serine peptidase [Bacteroidales bacterium]|nr:prolyl oligopeptidase family serine peptidase [Bacteroidales bacterium]